MLGTGRDFSNLILSHALLLVVLARTGSAQTLEQRDLPVEQVRALIPLLNDGDFNVRTRAERELSRAGLSSISMIETAARRDPENAARLVGVLERLMVDGADVTYEKHSARSACIPTGDVLLSVLRVGEFEPSETAVAAEQSLQRLAQQNSVVAGYSIAALNRHAVLRENRAIQELRRLGAKIIFQYLPEDSEYHSDETSAETISAPPMHGVELVYILSDWRGGTEGLALLNRLRVHHLPSFVVYLIEGNALSVDDVRAHAGDIPGLQIVERGAAAMGFSSNQRDDEGRCIVSGLVDGLSAQKAGLQRGDEIVAIDGRLIDRNFNKLLLLLKDYRRGDVVPVMLIRFGTQRQVEEVEVTLSGWEDIADVAPAYWGR